MNNSSDVIYTVWVMFSPKAKGARYILRSCFRTKKEANKAIKKYEKQRLPCYWEERFFE